ncbi:ABC transporter ATP-binding protein [Nitrincola sp. MINF-07-Sa-05]|uniref:ABC transporter ATP-binding protein n=1 Tax=Nitrincola salilacus TaxID=3400273 RepID=UPI003917BFCA
MSLILRQLAVGDLQPLSLEIAPGEILCLSGASGSGKSRLLRAIADLDPHQGSVWLEGTEQSSVSGHCWRSWVRLVPAESQWWFETVEEHFPADKEQDLSALGLKQEMLKSPVSRLSSGEKQRLSLVRALAVAPRALLLDEPTANLDPDATEQVERWLLQSIRAQQWPVIWVAHDPEQIARVASRHCQLKADQLREVRHGSD